MKAKFSVALALLTVLQFSNVNAAPIDRELAILASEQPQDEQQPAQAEKKVSTPTQKSKKELEAEEKKRREEQREAEKKLKAEKEAARKQIEEGRKEQVTPTETRRSSPISRMSTANGNPSIESSAAVVQTAATEPTTTQTQPPVSMPNTMTPYATFEDLAQALRFTPLYVPKKSGYTINEIFSVDGKIAQIRYGRRWEPNVTLYVRTYKRAPGEELQDISGLYGLKWRVDTTSGTTIYVSKVSDTANAAAWAVGDYTFAAYADNLSFAAFHALVVEELVDLSQHYYVS